MIKKIVVSIVGALMLGTYVLGLNGLAEEKGVENRPLKSENVEKRDIEDEVVNDELLTLVNYKNKISDDWQVNLIPLNNNQSIDQRAHQDLLDMIDDAKKEGLQILICSSYRTYEKQKTLFVKKVSSYLKQGYSYNEAQELASQWVAKPNTSEHQLGLAVDLVSQKNQRLDNSQEETKEQQWLMENCHRYGFILRYPVNKSEITKVSYEPWHYRYVGKEHAKKIMEKGITLEEYIDELKK